MRVWPWIEVFDKKLVNILRKKELFYRLFYTNKLNY